MFGIRSMLFGSLAVGAAMLGGPAISLPRLSRRGASTYYGGGRTRTTYHATNGKRERERRMRQIAAGSLRVENGLAIQ